ncbi:hypothetical protein [Caedibacter taeniospiralis]|uniref:hypothetical protein n=1 Tax=Caedibacter taeniospiralis TaxID=28907 RepID=UPI000C277E0A|nr:hypothetical protein [Caedibacter taeniospiralis]
MRRINKLIGALLCVPPVIVFAKTDYYITIDNQTPWDLNYVSYYLSRGSFDSSGFSASVAGNKKSPAIRINAASGPGGDTRVSGQVIYQSSQFSKYQASAYFNMDRHSSTGVYGFSSSTNSDDNLLAVSDSIDDRGDPERLTVVVKLKTNFFPYKFISLGLGGLNITACDQHAVRLGGGYYTNPCSKWGDDNYLSIGFANSPDLCRLRLDSGMEIKAGSLSCNMGTEARYIKDKAAIVFICQSKGYGTSSCPWVTVGTDSVSTILEGTF